MNSEIKSVFFNGSLIFTPDHQLFSAQISGLKPDIPLDNLANGINTDEIIPADACKNPDPGNLASHVMTGWLNGLVEVDQIRKAYPNIWIAGENFGSGSSREHAPIAMISAGCSLVIAESFTPIFRRNATNLGLYTSTDFSILQNIKNNQPIPLEHFSNQLDDISKIIINEGGLLPFMEAKKYGRVKIPDINTGARSMTIAEKWIAKYLGIGHVKPGDAGFIKPDLLYSYEYTAPVSINILDAFTGNPDQTDVQNPDRIILFNDHLSLDNDPRSQVLHEATRKLASRFNIKLLDFINNGDRSKLSDICHIYMLRNSQPGIIVGTDSHSTMLSPLGFAFGVGATDAAGFMYSGEVLIQVPHSTKINLEGKLDPWVTPRDLMLRLIASDKKSGHYRNRVVEFAGDGLKTMSFSDLTVLSNMTAELRGVTATFPPLDQIADYLISTNRALDRKDALTLYPKPDDNSEYAYETTVDLSQIPPTVAIPSSPDTGLPLDEIAVSGITKVIIGSCVGGGIEEIKTTANLLKNRHIAPGVSLFIHPNSQLVYQYARENGWLDIIRSSGGTVIDDIGCGTCIGVGPGTLTEGDICFTTASRNHTTRMGHPNAQVYLASAPVSVAAAILGHSPNINELRSLYSSGNY